MVQRLHEGSPKQLEGLTGDHIAQPEAETHSGSQMATNLICENCDGSRSKFNQDESITGPFYPVPSAQCESYRH